MINITSLYRYPVKGLRGIAMSEARVMARGFEYDREWMVVDAHNKFVTQRTAPVMATIGTQITHTHLVLTHDSRPPLEISLDGHNGAPEDVVVWRDTCAGVDQGEDAAAWLSDLLATHQSGPVRLMRFARHAKRAVEADYLNGEEAQVGFADGYPFLLANEATLDALNKTLDEPVPMNRFRANIVVEGLPALDEHRLASISAPDRDVTLALPKPCQRCKVTTVDQHTGQVAESREPLKTLVRTNPFDHLVGGYFGQNGIPLKGIGQTLTVGDALTANYA